MAAVRMAVMEIGAQDVIMKVYEIAPRKGMQVIDSLLPNGSGRKRYIFRGANQYTGLRTDL